MALLVGARYYGFGVVGLLVHDGAGVPAHRWLKVAFIPSNVVKATFSHYRTTSEGTRVTPVTGALPNLAVPSEEPHPLELSSFAPDPGLRQMSIFRLTRT